MFLSFYVVRLGIKRKGKLNFPSLLNHSNQEKMGVGVAGGRDLLRAVHYRIVNL